ncbi:hypothetical protein EVAR_62666_1 [Eumeta japonica]|uniref:Uncharacterized protein n=1 Tax=Eumeta variegata TaxID=151549 RepID=A0A4C1Z2J7_EUMVA|nr:hypothetical protein EVAR_62666_1 [Eumeta japonica]
MAISAPPRKPAFRISFTVASEYAFLQCVGKMMDSVSIFELVFLHHELHKWRSEYNCDESIIFFLCFSMREGGIKEFNELPTHPRAWGMSDFHGLKEPRKT